ncbi:unnamed protein product [Mytilus coruscus]|uniref:Uncharacterized protein n=1 Tax=Mytilus coruscus TaxID=42192 RepID=A0A6J8DEQ1_MYTCO|nr:unnamed protein product [Mytilus coruscus]
MKELYDQTKERLKTIEDYLKPNVKIHTIWECEFDQQKYPEVDPHLKPIDKRDAFYGGRTETIQLYNNLSDLKDTFMKYKQEASGCKCDPKYCKPDCENDKECKTKIQYIIDNAAYNLDIDKVKHNSGLRFIAKICLNNLWGHFEHITKIVFNEKYKDISTMILDENIVLTEYKEKEEYSKPNPSVNVYIALFTTAHARLKLYELLDILQERVLYMDTDSCIYNDDGSEAYEIVSKHNANHIKQFISAGPKDYSMKLDTEKLVSCCKGFRLNAEVEEKITLDKKKKIVTDENEKYETVKYDNIKIGKDHQLKTVKQVKAYDYMFDKRMICCLRDDGECPLTSKQMEVMEKFKGKKLSKFPPGWDAFIRPDKIYEYVFEKPCPEI